MKRLWLILPVLLIVGCSKDLDTLQDRGGIYFEINSEKPFSGSVNKKYQSGQIELEGIITNGKKDGLWTEWYTDGQKQSEKTYKDGEEDGFWNYWYYNGQRRFERTYKDGEIDGLRISWYESGQKRGESTYKNGEIDGLWTSWYENGQKEQESTYKDEKLISKKCWDEDGNECECSENYWEGCK